MKDRINNCNAKGRGPSRTAPAQKLWPPPWLWHAEMAPLPGQPDAARATDAVPDRPLAGADVLLAELRAEVARVVRQDFCGRPPAPLANGLVDALAIAEGYVANHEAEAARGW